MTASRSTTTRSSARTRVLNLLKDDHKQVKKAFREFEKLAQQSPEMAQALVEQTCAELAVHTTLEEELFYPAIRKAMDEPDLLDEAEVEHASAKTLIADLRQLTPSDGIYAATFHVLGEYVQHHIQEEENEIFPQLTRAKLDWDSLLEQMTSRRAALQEELLPAGGEADHEPAAPAGVAAREGRGAGAGSSHRR